MTQRRAEHRPSRLPDARTSRSGSRWGRSPGWYPAEGLSCSSLRRVPGAARRAGTRSPNPTPSRTRRRRRLASQPRRRRRPRRPRWLPPRPRKTRLPKVRVREGPRPLGGASETRVPGLRPSSSGRTLGGQPTGRAASASEACAWGLRGARLWAPRRPEGRGAARGDPRGAISAAEGGAARRPGASTSALCVGLLAGWTWEYEFPRPRLGDWGPGLFCASSAFPFAFVETETLEKWASPLYYVSQSFGNPQIGRYPPTRKFLKWDFWVAQVCVCFSRDWNLTCLTSTLYTWNYYNIIWNANCNFLKKKIIFLFKTRVIRYL